MVNYLCYLFALYLHMRTVSCDGPIQEEIKDLNSANITQVIKEDLSFWA